MSFDGIVTNSVVSELNEEILGGKIDKIYQQEADEILLQIRNKGKNHKLLLSASSNNPRIYLTDSSKENPSSPPMFCMLLRKHLIGGIILNIEQFEMDRIVFIDISSRDELGDFSEKRLIIEIMGKHSNIILLDKNSSKIMDSIKRIPEHISRVRQIYPGLLYENPPIGDKLNPINLNKDIFIDLIDLEEKNLQIYKFFYFNFLGISPLIGREVCSMAHIDRDRTINSLMTEDIENLYDSFNQLMTKVKDKEFTPLYIKTNDKDIKAFHALNIEQFGVNNIYYHDSISYILDTYYRNKDTQDRINQKTQSIRKNIKNKLDRAQTKLGKQILEINESKDREKYKIYGDILSANLYKIPKGLTEVELENFYSENLGTIKIPLDPKISPAINAQKYYKRYQKLKNANNLLIKQIRESKEEIEYLENVLFNIDGAREIFEIDEIKDELISEGYIRRSSKKNVKKLKLSNPRHYISSDGFSIFVGRNNRQNDVLTMKTAHKEDLWFHIQKKPGSHVIVKTEGKEVPDSTLEEAAILAAYYSKAQNSKNVLVDYTEKKHVRKTKGAKLGMVIYENFNSINVSPSEAAIEKMKKVD